MRLGRAIPALAILLLLLAGTVLAAGTYSIERHVLGGGGGRVTGGSYRLDHTVGQPVAGGASGGAYELCAGYWCGEGSPAAPEHRIYLPVVTRDW
jgi:hypothetical protein